MFRWLTTTLNRHPVSVPILSAGVLSFLGDVIAQQWIEDRPWRKHDWKRTWRQAVYGVCIIGPASCFWFRLLEHRVIHTNSVIRTAQRVALDQFLFTPIFLGIYFMYNAFCEGSSIAALEHKLKNGYLPALIANYKVWPAVQCINFYLIPLNFRVLFVNIIALGWCAFLSNLNAKHVHKHSVL